MVKLYCGDNLEIMQELPSESVDLTVTSPPYDDLRDYNGYSFDFEGVANELYRLTKQGGVVVWVVADKTKDGDESGTSFRQALSFKEIGFKLFDTMIFSKPVRPVGSPCRYYSTFEYMFVFSKGKPKTTNIIKDRKNKTHGDIKHRPGRDKNGKTRPDSKVANTLNPYGKRGNIWHYTIGGGSATDKIAHQHPAIFPEKLAEDHILSWSNEGDLVFDPMMGSGTTGKMAVKHNRKFIGVDISQEYIEIARQRLNPPQQELL